MKVELGLRNHSREVKKRDDRGRHAQSWSGCFATKGIINTLGETCISSCSEGNYFCNFVFFFFFFASVRLFQNLKKKKGKWKKEERKELALLVLNTDERACVCSRF